MFALIRLLVSFPHLVRDLQGLLQTFKTLGGGRKRPSQTNVLLFIPGSTNAEIGASVREDIQGGDRLDQQTRIPISNARDHPSQLDPVGPPGGKGQSTI